MNTEKEKILSEEDPAYVHPGVSTSTPEEEEDDELEEEPANGTELEKMDKKDELILVLNTGKEGKLEYVTSPIKGELDGVLISSDNIINIRILLDEFPDIALYQHQGFRNSKYLSLRNDITYSNNEKAQNTSAKWKLNDKLKIYVDGSWNTSVKIIFRYS